MSQPKTQSFPQDMDGNTLVRRFKFYRKTPKTTPNGKIRNDFQQNQKNRYDQSDRKTPGSFAKTYTKKSRRNSGVLLKSSGSKYSKEEKLKLIKKFEKTGAPLVFFSKWYGVGMNAFWWWVNRFQKNCIAGLDDLRVGANRVELPEGIMAENPGSCIGWFSPQNWCLAPVLRRDVRSHGFNVKNLLILC